jgi:HEPN domain-containing protein
MGRRITDADLNNFAIRSFRDTADQDYIAARLACRAGLIPQFHWSALQAIEKYLKGILLLNRIVAKNVRHDLERALTYAEKLSFRIELSKGSRELIKLLDTCGRFRYLETSWSMYGPRLCLLDQAVWEVRRYCQVLDFEGVFPDGSRRNLLAANLKAITASEKSPHRFHLMAGRLEEIVAKKAHPARAALIWQNFYFGPRGRKTVRMRTGFSAVNAPLSLHPEILDEVLRYVFLPKEVVEAFRREIAQRASRRS